MLYKYSAILDINPNEYDEVKGKTDNTAKEFGCTFTRNEY